MHDKLERRAVLARLLARRNALQVVRGRLAAVKHVLCLARCRDDLREACQSLEIDEEGRRGRWRRTWI